VLSKPVDQVTAADWAKVSQSTAADRRRVEREGFREAVQQQTATGNGGGGLDFVLELGSATAAREEQAAQLDEDIAAQHVPITRFAVPGVPGASAIAAAGGKQGSTANVLFTEGRCLLLVGDGEVASGYRARVVAGAQAIYRRTAAGGGACAAAG
jgi:hypothetical protein